MSDGGTKRYRDDKPSSKLEAEEEDDDGNVTTYVSVKARMEQKRQRLLELDSRAAEQAERERKAAAERARRERDANKDEGKSLLEIRQEVLRARGGQVETAEEKQREAEAALLESIQKERGKLLSLKEAAGVMDVSKGRMNTGWRPPRKIREMTEEAITKIRTKFQISVEGADVPPPITKFANMKFPHAILDALNAKSIVSPSPIQVQGLPVVLSGRDMVGIAFTGSGKTMVFTLPMVLFALRADLQRPVRQGEGPIGIAMSPSRELAIQIHGVANHFIDHLAAAGYPKLNCMLAIGDSNMADQWRMIPRGEGVHVVVATPGKLTDLVEKKKLVLDRCQYFSMDEADRLVDISFEENVKSILGNFKYQRQTVLFSATMPKQVLEFAKTTLTDPIVVNASRAGAANLDVIQEVEYVKEDARLVYLLECLQKTAPPVLVFAEKKESVDAIQEFLLLKGVDTVAIHGGLAQADRTEAIRLFREGQKDVLVATDVASKGLDFDGIQHVINYDMPKEIENYIHRIGRTGRRGKTGVATSFINRSTDETFLLDLKQTLKEAKQKIPPALMGLPDKDEGKACDLCGGPGHSALFCPKYMRMNKSKIASSSYDRTEATM